MEMDTTDQKILNIRESHKRCLVKAIDKIHELLDQDVGSRTTTRSTRAKSILYAAIEQWGMRGERIFSTQRLLRELLALVATQ